MVTEALALMNIRDVNFDERDGNACQRIPQGDAGVGQSAGINNDRIDFSARAAWILSISAPS
jgi:hypothetical protein